MFCPPESGPKKPVFQIVEKNQEPQYCNFSSGTTSQLLRKTTLQVLGGFEVQKKDFYEN